MSPQTPLEHHDNNTVTPTLDRWDTLATASACKPCTRRELIRQYISGLDLSASATSIPPSPFIDLPTETAYHLEIQPAAGKSISWELTAGKGYFVSLVSLAIMKVESICRVACGEPCKAKERTVVLSMMLIPSI